jgi:hypothetical protein
VAQILKFQRRNTSSDVHAPVGQAFSPDRVATAQTLREIGSDIARIIETLDRQRKLIAQLIDVAPNPKVRESLTQDHAALTAALAATKLTRPGALKH